MLLEVPTLNAVCDHNNFYQLLWMGYIVDGRPGGLVLGQSHDEGHIYMLRQEEHKYCIAECLEGGEYVINHAASHIHLERIKEINSFKEPTTKKLQINLTKTTRIFNTHAEPSEKFLWLLPGQFIVNKYATAKYYEELEAINNYVNPFLNCDYDNMEVKSQPESQTVRAGQLPADN
jgi:hypothetical protein